MAGRSRLFRCPRLRNNGVYQPIEGVSQRPCLGRPIGYAIGIVESLLKHVASRRAAPMLAVDLADSAFIDTITSLHVATVV